MNVHAINATTGAVSEYANFPFTSFAEFAGKALAAGPNGLYLLGGEVDNLTGDPEDDTAIVMSLSSGKSDLGSAQMKRVDSLQFGYTAAGDVIVNVIADEGGEGFSRRYQLPPQVADVPRAAVLKPGQGVSFAYLQIEIVASDVAMFDALRLYPVALSKRR